MRLLRLLSAVNLIVALLGVCLVPSVYAYPVSKASSNWNNGENTPATPPPATAKQVRPINRDSAPISKASHYNKTPLSPGTHNVAIGIGQVFLAGDLSKANDNALGSQLQYTYGVSDLFSFESSLGYSSHSGVGSNSLKLLQLVTGLRTNLIYFDQLVPFFSGGLGFYHPSITLPGNISASSILFGLNLGAGADLILSDRFYFGTRLTLHNMFGSTKTASDNLTQVNLGGTFLSFAVHVGFSF